MGYPDRFLLISKAAVDRFDRSSSGFRQFLARLGVPGGPVRRFPNGAIEINDVGVGALDEHPLRAYAAGGCELEGRGFFRTLAAFASKRFYTIQYPADYQERLRTDVGFINGDGVRTPPSPGEFELTALRVAVFFRTRVSTNVRRAFADAIAAWGRDAVEHGAFNDGPVQLVSPGVTFTGTRAQFLIDASRSGQDTLNWLSLAILDFAYDVQPITYIKFGHNDAELDLMVGPSKGDPVLAEFPPNRRLTGSPTDIAAPPGTYVPPVAQVSTSFRSESFRVLTLPVDEWDRFVATVYFGRTPTLDERQNFVELIRAWQRLGSYGGFGGRGTHSARDVEFDEDTDSAIIRADMGDTNPAIALAVLIRSLEGFQAGVGTPIDAVVFGTVE